MYTSRYYANYNRPSYNNSLYRGYLDDVNDSYRYVNSSERRYYGPRRSRRSYPWNYDRAFDRNVTRDEEEGEEEEEEEEEEPVTEEINKKLHVEKIALNVRKNALHHHTDKYECTMNEENQILVVRRGQAFRISVYFDRPYNIGQHQINFRFFIGKKPIPARHTEARLVMAENTNARRKDPKKWFVKLLENVEESKSVLLEITPPSNCIIGQWMFEVETESKIKEDGDTLKLIYRHDKDVFVLFNPYSEEDQVHMPTTVLLKEYIDCEPGVIFVGSAYQIGGRSWNFGQFQGKDGLILKTCLHILRKAFGNQVDQAMANPIRVARAISQMVNAPGDGGILAGKWASDAEEYSDGEVPWFWTGSTDILRRYDETKKPVKYGQCWVFSALTTTVCRAIGIPCRSVTNFQSAHDTDGSTTHDKYYRYNEEKAEFDIIEGSHNSDSIWNFHVWNEAWMKRPDIKEGDCDGWQVIDATPQEQSDGMFRCGPCPVSAIKRGDIAKPYDANFIFGEVNADDVMWVYDEQMEEMYVNGVDHNGVGKNISTKVPDGEPYHDGEDDERYSYLKVERFREDITHTYKHREGSDQERKAVKNAIEIAYGDREDYFAHLGRNRDVSFTGHEKEVRFALNNGSRENVYLSLIGQSYDFPVMNERQEASTKLNDVVIHIITKDEFMAGEDFKFTVKIINTNSEEMRTIRHLLIAVNSTSYTGLKVHNIIQQKFDYLELDKQKENEFEIQVTTDDYMEKMTEYFGMEINVSALAIRMTRNQDNYVDFIRKSSPFRLRRPGIHIKADENIRVGVPFQAKFAFENTMQKTLTNCSMHIGGNGIKDITIKNEDVAPKSRFIRQYELEAERPGEIIIIASFACRELADVTGSITVKAV